MIKSQVGRYFMNCCVGICMFNTHWQRQDSLSFRPDWSDWAIVLRCEGPQDLEKTLRDCKAQATLLLPTMQEQYFSTPVTGLLTTRLISNVYMGFWRQIRAYSGCWPREPEAMELQLMCYMPKLLWPAERQDISLSSGLWPAQTMSEISFPLCAEKHGDKDRQLV